MTLKCAICLKHQEHLAWTTNIETLKILCLLILNAETKTETRYKTLNLNIYCYRSRQLVLIACNSSFVRDVYI